MATLIIGIYVQFRVYIRRPHYDLIYGESSLLTKASLCSQNLRLLSWNSTIKPEQEPFSILLWHTGTHQICSCIEKLRFWIGNLDDPRAFAPNKSGLTPSDHCVICDVSHLNILAKKNTWKRISSQIHVWILCVDFVLAGFSPFTWTMNLRLSIFIDVSAMLQWDPISSSPPTRNLSSSRIWLAKSIAWAFWS